MCRLKTMTADACKLLLPLPRNFRCDDALAFHGRDAEGIAERANDQGFSKGILWQGQPARLDVRFAAASAEIRLLVDGPAGKACLPLLKEMAVRMLGLDQDVAACEKRFRRHTQLGPLLKLQAGLRVPASATPFEAIAWAVTGQQISVAAAVALRRRLVQAVGIRHSTGLYCFPSATEVSGLSAGQLRAAGFSQGKIRTLHEFSRRVCDGSLSLEDWLINPQGACDPHAGLAAVHGIGPWTVSYALLRGFGWLDGSLHGDVAVRRALQCLLGRDEAVGEQETREWLAQFSPWRALVAAHLWGVYARRAM